MDPTLNPCAHTVLVLDAGKRRDANGNTTHRRAVVVLATFPDAPRTVKVLDLSDYYRPGDALDAVIDWYLCNGGQPGTTARSAWGTRFVGSVSVTPSYLRRVIRDGKLLDHSSKPRCLTHIVVKEPSECAAMPSLRWPMQAISSIFSAALVSLPP